MNRLLAEVPDLDGVFAASDLMTQGALPPASLIFEPALVVRESA